VSYYYTKERGITPVTFTFSMGYQIHQHFAFPVACRISRYSQSSANFTCFGLWLTNYDDNDDDDDMMLYFAARFYA